MELTELSTQLKTFDLVDSQNNVTIVTNESNPFMKENRRLTRSQALPKSDLWAPISESSNQKNSKKTLDPEDEVKKIYLNNKVKIVHKHLETIFEDPILRKGNTMFLGIGKQKRSLYLHREFRITSKQKSKIRRTKIKRLGKRTKPFKISDDEFRAKMLRIDSYINGDVEEDTNEDSNIAQTEAETFAECITENSTEMQTP